MAEWYEPYGLTEEQRRRIVMVSNLSLDAAINDAAVPEDVRDLHDMVRPLLTEIKVIHHGFEEGEIKQGQLVVHQYLAPIFRTLFLELFKLKFPIYAVIPQAVRNYDDQEMMTSNYSSCYRPEWGENRESVSEHTKAAAIDLNTGPNPEVKIKDGVAVFNPKGATYDPNALGALYEGSDAVTLIRELGLNWAGGWGNPDAPEYYKHPRVDAHFDYQHIELGPALYAELKPHLPPLLRDM